MYPQRISEHERTARKDHTCSYCETKISKGLTYHVKTLKWENEIYQWKTHPECDAVAAELWDWADPWDDGMSSDIFLEARAAFCQQFICPDCDKWVSAGRWGECSLLNTECVDKVNKCLTENSLIKTILPNGDKEWKLSYKLEYET